MNTNIKKLEKREDARGYLFEILRKDEINEDIAQIHFSVSKPGMVRGNHYHNRKVEWFCVVEGAALLLLEDIHSLEKVELVLSGAKPQVVKIPPTVTHAIKNIGNNSMYLVVANNEVFDPVDTDTHSRVILS